MNSVWVGWDPREASAFAVARHSIRQHAGDKIEVNGLLLEDVKRMGLFWRPMHRDERGRLIDNRSVREDYDGSLSTEHANLRFVLPFLGSGREDWIMFCDGDILLRADLNEIFYDLQDHYAVYCVKHDYQPAESIKMDGQLQTRYARKNWSSVFLVNVKHQANRRLTLEMLNELPGRDLHAFCWLDDDEIGALDPKWNWLAGHSDPAINPALVHFTAGVPDMPGYESVPYADEWRETLASWAAEG